MNVLILGSGGREHTLTWKLSQSNRIKELFIAPGNAGTSSTGTNINIDPEDFLSVKRTVLENSIDIVIVGPEAPLVKGIVDFFESDSDLKGVAVIGPGKAAARLEGSKDFAKQFMFRHGIPTAAYRSFTGDEQDEAIDYLKTVNPPFVLKADGLAAGKGVVILDRMEEAAAELKEMFGGKFGSAGARVVIEEFLSGIELSVFVVTDGKNYKILPEAKDYKRIGEGDTGLNTGGMGAVSPVSFAGEDFMKKVEERIIIPTVKGLASEGIDYRGFIFFGLIKCGDDPFVIEYNVRMGDPETEVVIPRIKSDLFDIIEGIASRDLEHRELEIDTRHSATVMMVSGGYPGGYEKGKRIGGLENVEGSIVFHAGTARDGLEIVSSGGRVLAVTSYGTTMAEALGKSYNNLENISLAGGYYRRDIGFDL
ncbi:MAG: phosphoribosylamine--glycine ligase [Bacteroidales bacterium]